MCRQERVSIALLRRLLYPLNEQRGVVHQVPNGAVKWFTRKSRLAPASVDSKRRLARAALASRRRIADVTGHAAHSRVKRPRYRCVGCGYGIVSDGTLPNCPMCKGNDWVQSTRR